MLREEINPYASDNAARTSYDYSHGTDAEETQLAHPCLELQRVLSGGTFYYSVDFDLTNRLQDRSVLLFRFRQPLLRNRQAVGRFGI